MLQGRQVWEGPLTSHIAADHRKLTAGLATRYFEPQVNSPELMGWDPGPEEGLHSALVFGFPLTLTPLRVGFWGSYCITVRSPYQPGAGGH